MPSRAEQRNRLRALRSGLKYSGASGRGGLTWDEEQACRVLARILLSVQSRRLRQTRELHGTDEQRLAA
jgi:hypothetical protein